MMNSSKFFFLLLVFNSQILEALNKTTVYIVNKTKKTFVINNPIKINGTVKNDQEIGTPTAKTISKKIKIGAGQLEKILEVDRDQAALFTTKQPYEEWVVNIADNDDAKCKIPLIIRSQKGKLAPPAIGKGFSLMHKVMKFDPIFALLIPNIARASEALGAAAGIAILPIEVAIDFVDAIKSQISTIGIKYTVTQSCKTKVSHRYVFKFGQLYKDLYVFIEDK